MSSTALKHSDSVKTIIYADPNTQGAVWIKAMLLVPLWAVGVIPIVGFLFRGFGEFGEHIGFALVLGLCINYFLLNVLKQRIRLDDEYVYFGFSALPIKDINAIDVGYDRRSVQPGSLILTSNTGRRLKFNLGGLGEQSLAGIIKHLQTRNSTLTTSPVLATIVKCHKVTSKSIVDNSEVLLVPYDSRGALNEAGEAFVSAAKKWLRMGPMVVFAIAAPVWLTVFSFLYGLLQPTSLRRLHERQFTEQLSSGLDDLVTNNFSGAGESYQHVAMNSCVVLIASLVVAGFFFYLLRLLLRPTTLIADQKGIRVVLNFAGMSASCSSVNWSEISAAKLETKSAVDGSQPAKIALVRKDGKPFSISLAALSSDNRFRLLQRIERMVPDCKIEHELSRSMQPKSDRSYTEIWLQSLTQAPERQALEPLVPGQIVGDNRFEVLQQLGVGGQGTAYLCRDIHSAKNETVVLKETILPTFVDSSVRRKALERFEREARLLRDLDSDKVVRLQDYFVEDHRAYLVLEYVDGINLRALIARDGALPFDKALDIAHQMCGILDMLHKHQIVHRDFTPDNLILNARGKLKLIDFNVAQQLQSGTTGTIVGKHAYLPPEQFRGKPTMQSDIYAMGATLFYLIAGRDPEPISQSSPREANADTPEVLDKVVRKATALSPSERYQSASEIERDLLSLSSTADGETVLGTAPSGNGDNSRAVEQQPSVIDLSRKEVVENG